MVKLTAEQVHALRCVSRGELDNVAGHDLMALNIHGLVEMRHAGHEVEWVITQAGTDWLEQEK
ncbi:hypothetical protein [Paraburkholderia kururiensis]|uniref:hypothetical protein n=1 Tax=Paraburkholderia kururiensis TaxID=984307 RepID=UPI00034C54A7|nr:hypothetical protein [Paraburkholderia kururiensis]